MSESRQFSIEGIVIPTDSTIRDALAAIDAGGVETALICTTDGVLAGVVTDGDIRRALLRGRALSSRVSHAYTKEAISVPQGTARGEAIKIMLSHQIKCLPVVDSEGRLTDLHTLYAALKNEERNNWGLILAGGMGTRLRELTSGIPKPMLPVGDRPVLQHIVEHFVSNGIRRLFISVNYLASMIERHFGDGTQFNCTIEYLREEQALGTGGPLGLLPPPSDPVVIMNGDLLTRINIAGMLDWHQELRADATIAVRSHATQVPYGVVESDGGLVVNLVEKPRLWHDVNAGIYVVEPSHVVAAEATHALPITSILDKILVCGGVVGAYHMQESWVDIGVPRDFLAAQEIASEERGLSEGDAASR